MNEPNYEKFWKEAKEELDYWKQRCLAAERYILEDTQPITKMISSSFTAWQSLKQKQ